MKTYTDIQLKQTLTKMLPERLEYIKDALYWIMEEIQHDRPVIIRGNRVLDTELLRLCWLAEELTFDYEEYLKNLWDLSPDSQRPQSLWNQHEYAAMLWKWINHATWQQRTVALAQTLGIEIV